MTNQQLTEPMATVVAMDTPTVPASTATRTAAQMATAAVATEVEATAEALEAIRCRTSALA
jgi:hypothetical protein